jgi:hypothetical protein
VFENRVLSKIFGPKWDEVTVEWRRLHTEELNDVYSPNIIWQIKSRRIRLMGHVALWESVEVYAGFWWENLKERNHMEQRILKWIFKQWDGGKDWIDLA